MNNTMIPVIKHNHLTKSATGNAWKLPMIQKGQTRMIWLPVSRSSYVDGVLSTEGWLINKNLAPMVKEGWTLQGGQIIYDPSSNPETPQKDIPKGKIDKGFFTVVDDNGHRTYRFKEWKGKTSIGKLVGSDNTSSYFFFGFLTGEDIRFWRSKNLSEEVQAEYRKDIETILYNPTEAGARYAMESNNCARCGRLLTHPASIRRFLGPECAKVGHFFYDIHPDFSVVEEI